MQATNADILDFYFDGRTRGVRKLSPDSKEYAKFTPFFRPEKLFSRSC